MDTSTDSPWIDTYKDMLLWKEITMTTEELTDYWIPACMGLGWVAPSRLDGALGIDEYAKFMANTAINDRHMSSELRILLIKLAGPHGKTILRAFRIRKGLEK